MFFADLLAGDIKSIVITGALVVAYLIYLKLYKFYKFEQKHSFKQGRRFMGKSLPSYPNGWFAILRTEELKIKQTKYIDYSGQNVALFRGEDGKVYATDAYCAHMGANLAIGGTVKFGNCIQCPFHGWTFDGETGNCVLGSDKRVRTGTKYTYKDEVGDKGFKGNPFKQSCDENVKINTFPVREMYGFIFLWFHALPELAHNPPYEPFDITEDTKKLKHRGFSLNKVKSHVQDIPENGGDLMHFYYVHTQLLPYVDWIGARWKSKWIRGDDPQLREKLKHEVPFIQEFKTKLLDRFITEKNKQYIGCLSLDNYLKFPGVDSYFFFNATAFQVGPGLVYLFLKSQFFEVIFFQHMNTLERYNHFVYHEIYSNNYLPYWVSALMLRLEAGQVINDGVVWDNKKFAHDTYYNLNAEPDKMLLEWRTWFSQFYEGCKEAEEKKEALNW